MTVKAGEDCKVLEASSLKAWPPNFTTMETRLSEVRLLSWVPQGKSLCSCALGCMRAQEGQMGGSGKGVAGLIP